MKRRKIPFVYELRIWSGLKQGQLQDAIVIPVPVCDIEWKADRYAFDALKALWGYCVRDLCDESAGEVTRSLLLSMIDIGSLKAIDLALSDLPRPWYGLNIRKSKSEPPKIMMEFCTQQIEGLKTADAIAAAEVSARRIAA